MNFKDLNIKKMTKDLFQNKFSKDKAPQNESVANTLLCNKLSFAATEAYKLLRTNLLFTLPGEKKCKVVGVTSSVRGEGKSTTALNLSYAIAETDKKVLIIDGDLRLPSLAKKLEMNGTPGLSNLLIGGITEEEVIRISDKLDGWHILPSGDIPPNPTEMLASAALKKLISKFSKSYDFIIIDLPPVNLVSDALVISPLLDGMIVVVRDEYSEKRAFSECIKHLKLANVKVLGVVMNVDTDNVNKFGSYRKRNYRKYMAKYYKSTNYYQKAAVGTDLLSATANSEEADGVAEK